jgi:hypothetical protein
MARAATSAAVRGRRLTKKLSWALERGLASVWKNKESVEIHGVEITREVARGAMHVADEKPLSTEQLAGSVTTGVVEASSRAGISPMNGILGASQGIIQGAAETGIDLGEATLQAIEAAKGMAAYIGLSEEDAVDKAAEGALQAAEAIGPEAVAEVVESLPEGILATDDKEVERGV